MASISPELRSNMMRSIRKTDIGPEKVVRRLIRELGAVGYRLHAKDLPGCPDIVFRRTQQAIFVHGCFWHQHSGCRLAKRPSARPQYWPPKPRNQERGRAAGVDEVVINHLVGHSNSSVGAWYGRKRDADGVRDTGYPLPRLAEEIGRVRFDGVDFDRLIRDRGLKRYQ